MSKGARVPLALGGAMIAAGLVTIACLPDPDRSPIDSDAGDASTTIPQRACGDGFIDPTIDGSPEECDPGAGKGTGCSPTCRVECEGGIIDPITKHCYFRGQDNGSELNAGTGCNDGHIVTFASDNEVSFLEDAGYASGFWVGLTYDVNRLGYTSAGDLNGEPGWSYPADSTSCPGCYARTGSDASTYFPPLGPAPDGGMPACVYVDSPTSWHHTACSSAPHKTLCEREPPGSRATVCNGGICITVAQTTKRYLFVPSDTTADDAKTSCMALGGSLVVFETREEREQLTREIARYTAPDNGTTFWVGLAVNDQGAYVWDDPPDAAPPPIFGIDAGTAAPGARIFISVRTQTDAIDIGLGHADEKQSVHPYVCQY